jgi:hypothetical protein
MLTLTTWLLPASRAFSGQEPLKQSSKILALQAAEIARRQEVRVKCGMQHRLRHATQV